MARPPPSSTAWRTVIRSTSIIRRTAAASSTATGSAVDVVRAVRPADSASAAIARRPAPRAASRPEATRTAAAAGARLETTAAAARRRIPACIAATAELRGELRQLYEGAMHLTSSVPAGRRPRRCVAMSATVQTVLPSRQAKPRHARGRAKYLRARRTRPRGRRARRCIYNLVLPVLSRSMQDETDRLAWGS